MSKIDEIDDKLENQEHDEVGLYVKFSKPYRFEDDMYDGIDLSSLSNLTVRNLDNIEKNYYKYGLASFNPENTATYAKVVAQEATGLPIEFFDQLPLKEMYKIKSRVVNFLYGQA